MMSNIDLNNIFNSISGHGTDLLTKHDLMNVIKAENKKMMKDLSEDPENIEPYVSIVGYDVGDENKEWYVIRNSIDTDIPKEFYYKFLAAKMVKERVVPLAIFVRFEHWQIIAGSKEEYDKIMSSDHSLKDMPGRQEGVSLVISRQDGFGYGQFYKINRGSNNEIILELSGEGFFNGDTERVAENRAHRDFFSTYNKLMEKLGDKSS